VIAAGQTIGRYRVVAPLGRGGMGGVFHVVDSAGRDFALKAPNAEVDANAKMKPDMMVRRLAREAHTMQRLEHPNLASAVDVFVEGGTLYLVMERVVGRSLTTAISDGLTPRQVLVIARQILEGAGYAHGFGIVHRDLKPDNVLLSDQGGWERAKIIDFGLLKNVGEAAGGDGMGSLTKTGAVHGTPEYMAPEQSLGQPLDHRADLYSVGVIIYEALTRQLPLFDEDQYTLLRMVAKVPPPPLETFVGDQPWITPALRALVERALEKKRDHRFRDAAHMIEALDRAFRSLDALS